MSGSQFRVVSKTSNFSSSCLTSQSPRRGSFRWVPFAGWNPFKNRRIWTLSSDDSIWLCIRSFWVNYYQLLSLRGSLY